MSRLVILPTVLLAILVGCAKMQIQSAHNPLTNFSTYRTYQWLPETRPKTGDPRIDNPDLDSRIRNLVDARLSIQGYPQKLSGPPDFYVAYHVALKNSLSAGDPGANYGYQFAHVDTGSWGGDKNPIGQYERGVLLLDILDATTRKLVWRGSARADVDLSAPQTHRDEQLRKAVRGILERFPPRQ